MVAFGSQDTWLTGSPQITYFRIMYRRHTLFAIEPIIQTWNGTVGFNKRASVIIARNGDLASSCILEFTFQRNSAFGTSFFPTEAFIQEVVFNIGGQKIDGHTNTWLRLYSEMFRKNDEKRAYQRLNDFVDGEADGTVKRMYLPLVFFWNRTVGLSLPLIALILQGTKAFHSCDSSSHMRQGGCGLEAPICQSQMLVACCA